MAKKEKVDFITLELIKNSLISIIDEMALTMVRSCYSHVVREIFDFATGLCDAEGNMIGEGRVNPGHAGVFPIFVRTLRKIWGERIYPGDVFVCNDPYEGASHLPDVYFLRPIFIEGELVAFSGAIAHQLDVGGRTPGSNACDNTEIFQEGLRMPPLKYYERGERNYTLYRILEKNVRMSDKVIGDMESQVAATGIGERKLIQLAEKYGGWPTLRRYLNELMDYSERLTRAVIRELPDGVYEFEDFVDDDGFGIEAVKIRTKIIIESDRITFDFTGSSPQVKGSLNIPFASTGTIVSSAMRSLLDPSIPSNSGVHRPITIIAPEGSIVNAAFPIGVAGRAMTMGRLWDSIVGAMAKIAPDKIPAANTFIDFGICMGGMDPEGNPFVFTDFLMGSWGGRPWADGIDASTCLFMNYSNTPSEVIEQEYPLRIEQYTFVPDTGGAGKYRGGLAMIRDYRLLADETVVQWRQDRAVFQPWGLKGGKPGSLAEGYHFSDGNKRALKKEIFVAKKGDLLRAILPGAGGWGPPYERDVELVLDDVRNGKVSIAAATRDYGVAIDEKTMQVDLDGTKKLRQAMRQEANTRSSLWPS